ILIVRARCPKQAIGLGRILSVAESSHAVDLPHRRSLLLDTMQERGPGPVAVLQRQHVQRIGKDEPVGDPAAENVARPAMRVGVSRTDGAKQPLGLGAVLADPLGPQFVMKLLVHGSSQPPDVRLLGQGGARTTHDRDRYARWAEPSPRTGGTLAH